MYNTCSEVELWKVIRIMLGVVLRFHERWQGSRGGGCKILSRYGSFSNIAGTKLLQNNLI